MKVKIPKQIINDLENVSRILFPLEGSAVVVGVSDKDQFHGKYIEMGWDYAIRGFGDEMRFYRESQNFDELIERFNATLRAEGHDHFSKTEKLKEHWERAKSEYAKLKECNRRAKAKECKIEPYELDLPESCAMCDAYNVLKTIPSPSEIYDDCCNISKPFLLWHTHPVSEHSDAREIARPSGGDLSLVGYVQLKASDFDSPLQIVGELITGVSENGECCTRAYSPPVYKGHPWMSEPPFDTVKELELIAV